MGKLKQCYESTQALNARVRLLEQELFIRDTTSPYYEQSCINPMVKNSTDYNMVLSIHDMVQRVNRYETKIPELNLPSNKLEMLWYLYGSLCFFKNRGGEVQVSTYSKTGKLNPLGDLTEVKPISFSGETYEEKRTVVYDNSLNDNPCVIINDFTMTYREETIIPASTINGVSINDQSFVYKQMKNSIKLTAKKAAVMISDPNQKRAYEKAISDEFDSDNPILSVVGSSINDIIKFYNLDTKLDIEGYLRTIESYERLRANFNGIKTRSAFDKKERLITSEAENDNVLTDIYLYDGLNNRKIGIELMKQHSIIKEGSCEINKVLFSTPSVKTKSENEGK